MEKLGIVPQILLSGVVATAALDAWQRLARLLFGTSPTNWALVGRWFFYLSRGKFVHNGIGFADPIAHEAAIGWIAHYLVGLAYAAIYIAGVHFVLRSGPTLPTAVAFGVVTVIAPWLILQPGMGMGVFASKAPKPGAARVQSLSSHAAFGVGLYLGCLPLAMA